MARERETVWAATRRYEAWVKTCGVTVAAGFAEKHRRMTKTPFAFLRGSFYRWVDVWRAACPDLARAPQVLGVGDLHIENFGTWRDADGRLVWGVNDFDETARMPYTLDLVRLATSALLVQRDGGLELHPGQICSAILQGYGDALAVGGHAFVLEERHADLRALALSADREPVAFWNKLTALPSAPAPPQVRSMLSRHLPAPRLALRIAQRTAGVGSLGRPRLVALAAWNGGLVAREAKALLPSAYDWALNRPLKPPRGAHLVAAAVRCQDPTYRIDRAAGRDWVVRRLAPHCSRIELSELPGRRDETALLKAMGAETANLHLASRAAIPAVRADLARRRGRWLQAAGETMMAATLEDWEDWCR